MLPPLPTGAAPRYHWYVGAPPPFVGVAVKVTEVPEQTGFELAAIDTLAAKTEFTVMVPVEVQVDEPSVKVKL